MFSYNGRNRLESKTTRMFRPVRRMAAPVGRQTTLFGRDGEVAVPRAKSAVSDYSLLALHSHICIYIIIITFYLLLSIISVYCYICVTLTAL